MRRRIRKRKCKHCNNYFLPDYRSRTRQKYCTDPSCRKASKSASQQRWLAKPENRNYFKGQDNVERVQRWRKNHPGYWRKSAKVSEPKIPLQDSLSVETVETMGVEESLSKDALQDVLSAQELVIIGLIAQLSGTALQDDIASTARRLRQLGHDVLNCQFQQRGGSYDSKKPPMSGANPQTSGSVQLAGSPPGS